MEPKSIQQKSRSNAIILLDVVMLNVVAHEQCDQIRQKIPVWLLFAWAFFRIYLNKQFQNMVCCIYFNIQKQFDVTILAFECEL
jgi:hypothetical protein